RTRCLGAIRLNARGHFNTTSPRTSLCPSLLACVCHGDQKRVRDPNSRRGIGARPGVRDAPSARFVPCALTAGIPHTALAPGPHCVGETNPERRHTERSCRS
ncbi:hypothetical protein AOLI_G00027280, partial [Acnodon oligacanthus]